MDHGPWGMLKSAISKKISTPPFPPGKRAVLVIFLPPKWVFFAKKKRCTGNASTPKRSVVGQACPWSRLCRYTPWEVSPISEASSQLHTHLASFGHPALLTALSSEWPRCPLEDHPAFKRRGQLPLYQSFIQWGWFWFISLALLALAPTVRNSTTSPKFKHFSSHRL